MATAALLDAKQPFYGYGSIDDMATAALLDAKPPFAGYGSIDDMATSAELNSARAGNDTFRANSP